MQTTPNHRDLALLFHQRLPVSIKTYLNSSGIPDAIIHRYRLGWDGKRITIPITNRNRQVTFFRLAKAPGDSGDGEIASSRGAYPELYGWEHLGFKREQLIICDGEFDRLVLEAHGFPAVTPVASDGEFDGEWAAPFTEVENVFACFHNDETGAKRARIIERLIPHCRVVQLPGEVGKGGTIMDFFTTLARSREDFLALLEMAGSGDGTPVISVTLP
jgi:DNA primase